MIKVYNRQAIELTVDKNPGQSNVEVELPPPKSLRTEV